MTDQVALIVAGILSDVRLHGDRALCRLAKKFDKVSLKPADLQVRAAERRARKNQVSPQFMRALQECGRRIEVFAKSEKRRLPPTWIEKHGSARIGQLIRPVDSVGVYIPGGRFPYPSTVLMTAIPAKIAGVKRIVMASPPKNLTPEVLAAADYAGVETIYRVGGAGAIAALAYGTKTIQKVDLIVGPGNQFVTEAKRQIYGAAGIDSLAGPSEVVIVADASTPIQFVLMDLLAQAEHDPGARSFLFSTDRSLLAKVAKRLDPSISKRVRLNYVPTVERGIAEGNKIAPEHFELMVKRAERYLPQIRHAGAIFLGPQSPAAMGDYVAGPSHVLPTSGSAKFSSGLSVSTFMKRSSVIGFGGKHTQRSQWEAALTMAQTEGMHYHERSLRCRLTP